MSAFHDPGGLSSRGATSLWIVFPIFVRPYKDSDSQKTSAMPGSLTPRHKGTVYCLLAMTIRPSSSSSSLSLDKMISIQDHHLSPLRRGRQAAGRPRTALSCGQARYAIPRRPDSDARGRPGYPLNGRYAAAPATSAINTSGSGWPRPPVTTTPAAATGNASGWPRDARCLVHQ